MSFVEAVNLEVGQEIGVSGSSPFELCTIETVVSKNKIEIRLSSGKRFSTKTNRELGKDGIFFHRRLMKPEEAREINDHRQAKKCRIEKLSFLQTPAGWSWSWSILSDAELDAVIAALPERIRKAREEQVR